MLDIAAAVLGDRRAVQLADLLRDRAEQLRAVGVTARTDTGDSLPRLPMPRPAPASLAALSKCRSRIEELDPSLKAFAWIGSDAAADEAAPAVGSRALDGFVVAVKDAIDVAGMPTRCGSALTSPKPVPSDAPVITPIRRAGAAVVGKTRCTEWALNDPAPTRNPWKPTRTPGGSSAGSAVAVATGMCTASVDTQTAGDVARPAAYNGVVGFKPSFGWTSTAGVQPVAPTIDTIGLMARTVGEIAALYSAITGVAQATAPPRRVRPLCGIVRDAFFGATTRAVQLQLSATVGRLVAAGAIVEELSAPVDLSVLHAAHRLITFAECASLHRLRYARSRHRYGPRARELLDLGLVTPAHGYLDAQRVRHRATKILSRLFDNVEVLLLPVTRGVAPRRDTTGDSTFQIPWTVCGFPSLALPIATVRGLPVALHLVGAQGHDEHLLSLARWCEQTLGVTLSPPI